ncbi:hypothetical protein [Bacteroides sp.]|uniref:hypothetical protein n=1 Tax=Bacteroides sp. TaxID=29523 RepID=UPI0026124020|nr:hypothetical protein [Bacteroides sp.]
MMMSCQEVILPETGITVTVDAEDGSSYTQTILTPKVEGKDVTLKGGKIHTITASRMTKLEPASMTFKVKVTAADNTFSIPFPIYGATPANMTVTWEEGGKAVEILAGTTLTDKAEDDFNHTYYNADPNGTEYTITITSAQTDGAKQQIPDFNFYSNRKNNSNQKKLISMDTPLLNTGATNFNFCFNECEALKEIPKELFTNNTGATGFFSCFGKCAALTTIHEALFANNPEATNFGYCFYECKALKEIPEKLFANNKKANNFGDCFSSCAALTTIPAALFANNQEAEKFSYCFYYCKALKEIPEALFANNTKVKDFSYCFNGCEVLTTIPAALFANNQEATNFNYCFYYCAALGEIPVALFTNNKEATNFEYCFSYCTSLEEIPQGLFDENTKAEIFSSCFSSCSNLATIPEGLFANNPEATDFRYCFYSCNHAKLNAKIFSMDGNSEGNKRFEGKAMKFDYCFNNTGSSLTDADIVAPQLWKYATGAGTTWTMDGCFAGCKANSSSWTNMNTDVWGSPAK